MCRLFIRFHHNILFISRIYIIYNVMYNDWRVYDNIFGPFVTHNYSYSRILIYHLRFYFDLNRIFFFLIYRYIYLARWLKKKKTNAFRPWKCHHNFVGTHSKIINPSVIVTHLSFAPCPAYWFVFVVSDHIVSRVLKIIGILHSSRPTKTYIFAFVLNEINIKFTGTFIDIFYCV